MSLLVALASSAAVIAPATTTATAAMGTTGALFTRARGIDGQVAAAEVLAVHRGQRLLRLFVGAHGDESEATGTARCTVHHQVGFHDGAVCGKRVLEIVFGGIEGNISHEQFIVTHVMFVVLDYALLPRLFPSIRISNHH